MDLINDYICHCPLGKQRALATCLQKYHAINFSAHGSLGIHEDAFPHMLTCRPVRLLLIIFQCYAGDKLPRMWQIQGLSFETL